MTELAYDNLAQLKAERADNAKTLRWVEDKLSWYQSNPLSTAAADDDTVVMPDVGVGRWLKQNSRANVVQGLTSQILTSNTTVSAGTKNYCDTSGGTFTLTLPASPGTGAYVAIYALVGTTLTNKITINPNGANIAYVSGNREITVVGDYIELEFVVGTGWIIKYQSNTNVLKSPTSGINIANPVSVPNYTGIMNYLGRQKNTVSFQNPSDDANSRLIRTVITTFGGSEVGIVSGGDGNIISNLVTGVPSTVDGYTAGAQSTSKQAGYLWIDFTANNSVRASAIQYSIVASRWTGDRPRRILIYGANTFNSELVGGTFTYGSNGGAAQPQLFQGFTDIELVANLFDVATAAQWTLSGGSYHRLLTVNSAKFYRHYIINQTFQNFTNSGFNYLGFVNQLEFYGDVVAT
jgi:hypothetical protein